MNYFRGANQSVQERVDFYLSGFSHSWLNSGKGYFILTGEMQKDAAEIQQHLQSKGFKTESQIQYADRAYQYHGIRIYLNPLQPTSETYPRRGRKLLEAYYGVE